MVNKRTVAKCVLCDGQAENCHVKSRGSGGSNEPWNIVMMCRKHHSEQHLIGWSTFYLKHEKVREDLRAKGWEFDDYTKRLFNYKNRK